MYTWFLRGRDYNVKFKQAILLAYSWEWAIFQPSMSKTSSFQLFFALDINGFKTRFVVFHPNVPFELFLEIMTSAIKWGMTGQMWPAGHHFDTPDLVMWIEFG